MLTNCKYICNFIWDNTFFFFLAITAYYMLNTFITLLYVIIYCINLVYVFILAFTNSLLYSKNSWQIFQDLLIKWVKWVLD